jgi:hypothetical protein
MLIAQNDDPEILEWLNNASLKAASFLSSLAFAALLADWENYPIIRPVVIAMRDKYPQYDASDAVKREIRQRIDDGPHP